MPICSGGVSPIAMRTEMRPSTAKYAAQASRLRPRSPSHTRPSASARWPGPGPAHHEDAVEPLGRYRRRAAPATWPRRRMSARPRSELRSCGAMPPPRCAPPATWGRRGVGVGGPISMAGRRAVCSPGPPGKRQRLACRRHHQPRHAPSKEPEQHHAEQQREHAAATAIENSLGQAERPSSSRKARVVAVAGRGPAPAGSA